MLNVHVKQRPADISTEW